MKVFNSWKYYIKILLCNIIIFIIHFNIDAQKIWSLQECIDYALENNIQIKKEKLNTLKKDNALQQAKWNLLPDMNAGYIHQYKTGFSLNDINYYYNNESKNVGYMGIESNFTIFNGFTNLNKLRMHEYELEKSLSDYHTFRNEIILFVISAYLQVLLDKEILDMARNQLDITSLQVEKIEKLVTVGNLAKGELMKIQALEANDKLSVVQSQNKLKISYLNLTQLLELESSEGFEIFIPEIDNLNAYQVGEIEIIYQQALDNLPQIKSSELEVKSMEKSLQIARGGSYPVLKLRTNLNSWYLKTTGYDSLSIFDQIGDQKEMIYSLELTIPVFNKLQVNKSISNAKLDLLDAQYSLDLQKKKLYKQIQQAYTDATAAFNKYSAAQEAVRSNQEAFKYTEQKFNVGLVTSVDYNQVKNELLKAQSELLISKYEYIFKTKILDFYSGKPFTL